jgi:hypothetical protein
MSKRFPIPATEKFTTAGGTKSSTWSQIVLLETILRSLRSSFLQGSRIGPNLLNRGVLILDLCSMLKGYFGSNNSNYAGLPASAQWLLREPVQTRPLRFRSGREAAESSGSLQLNVCRGDRASCRERRVRGRRIMT